MFMRGRQRKSETDLRGRRSLETIRALAHGRSSEQIPRNHPPPPPLPRPMTSGEHITSHDRPPGSSHTVARSKSAARFSLLRLRNASDPAIGTPRDPNPPPLPTHNSFHHSPPPAIITTAPTGECTPSAGAAAEDHGHAHAPRRAGTMRLWRPKPFERERPAGHSSSMSEPSSQRSSLSTKRFEGRTSRNNSTGRLSRVTFDAPERPHSIAITEPPPYEDQNASLPLPGPRLSESSRSTASSSGDHIACSTTTTTHTTTTTTFFRLPRRKKKEQFLFPLPMRLPEGHVGASSSAPDFQPPARPLSMISSPSSPGSPTKRGLHGVDLHDMHTALGATAAGLVSPGAPMLRSNSLTSAQSASSNPSPTTIPANSQFRRNRSSTMSSIEPGFKPRSSIGDFFARVRKDSEPMSLFGPPLSRSSSPQPQSVSAAPSASSAPPSGSASREMIIPERHDGDTPPAYLSKLLQGVSKSVIASLLARNGDPFHQAVLKVYMESFEFENDPMDMALRKLLMEVELPSETQQIDRVLQAFADRYHQCNPFIYQDSDQAYFVGFSLIMLHTDFFNKNNKHKMQKQDYIKNTSGALSSEGISSDILECFYYNIIYTPFIRVEDEYDINGEKIVQHRPKRGMFRPMHAHDGKRIKEPVDPYTLIIDNQLELLRPTLKEVLQLEDPYTYTGTASRLDMLTLHKAFFRSAVLQILSARSRPDAFMSANTTENPDGAHPGVVEIKVTKVGFLWRKDMKRKRGRSPWHEWGAILTGSQLYFFRNLHWIKSLISQYEEHHKHGIAEMPVVFQPALEEFKADAQVSTDDTVALLDKNYKKHKHAFAFIRHGNIQEYFIAENEVEMNDWLAKLNYAATFRTAGVRMRGVVGSNYDGQRARSIRRLDHQPGSPLSHSVQTPSGEVSIVRGGIDAKLASEISEARKAVVAQRIMEAEDRLAQRNKELQTYLRNARHLMILTPIQPKVREQVVMAAGQLAAKLQWVRMEMAKLRCHRDILALDMEEENKSARVREQRGLHITTPPPLPRINSHVSPVHSAAGSPTVGAAPSGSPTPTQSVFASSPSAEELTTVPSHSHKSMASGRISWHNRQSSLDASAADSNSSGAPRSPSTSSLMPPRIENSFNTEDKNNGDSRSHRSPTPTISESSFGAEAKEKEKEEEKNEKSEKKFKGKDRESSIRKSLQRTLRDQGLHKKGKDEDGAPGEKKSLDEGLARGSGSFTVHGKKASVITFGSEWHSMSPEDRLRRHKSTQAGGSEAGDNDGVSLQAESMTSMLTPSRRGSQSTVGLLNRDHEGLPPVPVSKQVSNATCASIGIAVSLPEGLADVNEHAAPAPGSPQKSAEEQLLEKLNGVAAATEAAGEDTVP